MAVHIATVRRIDKYDVGFFVFIAGRTIKVATHAPYCHEIAFLIIKAGVARYEVFVDAALGAIFLKEDPAVPLYVVCGNYFFAYVTKSVIVHELGL